MFSFNLTIETVLTHNLNKLNYFLRENIVIQINFFTSNNI